MLGQVLNARGSFGPMMWAPVVNNLVAIAGGAACSSASSPSTQLDPSSLRDRRDRPARRRHHPRCRRCRRWSWCRCCAGPGFRYRPRFDFRGFGLGKAGDLAKWTLLFVLVNQLAYIVIVNLALRRGRRGRRPCSSYGVGYAAYANAYLIFILPHSIITVSVMTGLLPRMSRAGGRRRPGRRARRRCPRPGG